MHMQCTPPSFSSVEQQCGKQEDAHLMQTCLVYWTIGLTINGFFQSYMNNPDENRNSDLPCVLDPFSVLRHIMHYTYSFQEVMVLFCCQQEVMVHLVATRLTMKTLATEKGSLAS